MTEIQIPYLPSAQFFKILCRLGVNEQDVLGDSDSDPQIRTIGGTVSIATTVPRFRYTEADGRKRVVYTKNETYNIDTTTGELVDADGNLGVNLLNTNSPQMDPQGWTYKATIRPNGGDPFDAFIPSNPEGWVYDLGDGLVFTPSTGITTLEARVKALEDAQGGASGLPENFDESVQDIVGAMVAGAGGTYDDAAGTIVLPSGGGGTVSSVAGRTGIVVLSSADLTDAASMATDAELTAGLAAKANSSHTHAPEDITGTAVTTTDSRLSDARTPLAHAHTLADVTDYAAPDLSGYVTTTDSRLSDARTPLAHAHPARARAHARGRDRPAGCPRRQGGVRAHTRRTAHARQRGRPRPRERHEHGRPGATHVVDTLGQACRHRGRCHTSGRPHRYRRGHVLAGHRHNGHHRSGGQPSGHRNRHRHGRAGDHGGSHHGHRHHPGGHPCRVEGGC